MVIVRDELQYVVEWRETAGCDSKLDVMACRRGRVTDFRGITVPSSSGISNPRRLREGVKPESEGTTIFGNVDNCLPVDTT